MSLSLSFAIFQDGLNQVGDHGSSPRRIVTALATAALVWSLLRAWRRIRVKSVLRGLPGPSNPSWLQGNFPQIYDVLNFRWHYEAVKTYGNVFLLNGMFGDEQLYITDARAIHQILVKDINIWEEPQSLLNINTVMFGNGLLSTVGAHHKRQRKILNPVFSEKHMRGLLPIFVPIVQKLCTVFDEKTGSGSADIDVYRWATRTGLELIAQGGMGTSLDNLAEGETSDLSKLVKEMVPTISRLHIPIQFLPLVHPMFSKLPEQLRNFIRLRNPFVSMRSFNRTVDKIENVSRTILGERRKKPDVSIGDQAGYISRDILGVLLKAQKVAVRGDTLPDSELVAEITTLLFTGMDTTSSAVSRILHVLATHLAVQSHLRAELRKAAAAHAEASASTDGANCEFGRYETLMKLPLLDAVVRETLRLYPPVSWIWRVARQPTLLPLQNPVQLTSGHEVDAIPVTKNQGIVIGIAACQRDQNVWGEDAEQWKPERWLSAEVSDGGGDEWKAGSVLTDATRYPGIYSGMMTFSGGGRSCIGFKFALLSTKFLLASLISRYEFKTTKAKDIVWNMNHIAAPTIRGEEKQGAQMILSVAKSGTNPRYLLRWEMGERIATAF